VLGRVLVLIGALLVAIIGTGLVFLYVQGAKARAVEDAGGTKVYVASTDIAAGTTVEEASKGGLLSLVAVPADAQLVGTFSESTLTSVAGQEIAKDLVQNQQLVAGDLGPLGASDPLGVGSDNAVQLAVGDPQQVSGYVKAGSFVAVYVTFEAGVVDNEKICTQLLIDKVQVLALGTAAVGAVDATGLPVASTNTNVTLRVPGTSDLGQRLIQAQADGKLYFVLAGEDGTLLPPETPNSGSKERCLSSDDLHTDPIAAGTQTVAPAP
jgi:pilus assembly protein CpaB